MSDEELHQTKMEVQPGSNYWEWATAEQQARMIQKSKSEAAASLGTVTASRAPEHQMKIFWSWQSDTPGKTGRFLIRDALRAAIDQLKQTRDIEEPTRESLHLDQDIQGVQLAPYSAKSMLQR